MMKFTRTPEPNQAGFTIVELMIALSIFTTILLLSSILLIRLGSIFTKGTNQASAQNVARTLVDDISSQLEFSGVAPIQYLSSSNNSSNPNVVCFGTSRYTYLINHRVSGDSLDHGLWRDTLNTDSTCQANMNFSSENHPHDGLNPTGNGVELLPEGMRLTQLDVVANTDSYTVTVTVAYGEEDLVNFVQASAGPPAVETSTSCNQTTGSQYCAVASLSRTVSRRIGN